jgi:hypothetical protein
MKIRTFWASKFAHSLGEIMLEFEDRKTKLVQPLNTYFKTPLTIRSQHKPISMMFVIEQIHLA